MALNIHYVVRENRLRRFKGNLQHFTEYLGRLTGDLLKHEAGLTSLEFINRTSPILPRQGVGKAGLDSGARQVGERAVERDIRSIFRPTDDTLAGAVDPAYGSREAFDKWKRRPLPKTSNQIVRKIWEDQDVDRAYAKAQRFFASVDRTRGISDETRMRSVHDRERNASRLKGRVTRGGGPTADVKKRPYYADAAIIQRYVASKVKAVGKAKAGWWDIIRNLGTVKVNNRVFQPAGRRVPAWVKRHGGGNGMMIAGKNKVTILNRIGNVHGIAVESNTVQEVINSRNISLNQNPYLQREVDRALRLWNAGRIKASII